MSSQVTIERAGPGDIPAIAAIFTASFTDSILHHCGRLPKPQAMQDVFQLAYEAEPQAAFVARNHAGAVTGYCFAPTVLPRLWIEAVTGGHVCRWVWRWVSGQYGFGLQPVKMLAMNKAAFFRSAFTPRKAANARILSIAVDPACRGQGIAGRLLQAAIGYFRLRGVRRVRLEVRPDNAAAIKVYTGQGFYRDGYSTDSQGQWLIMFKEMEQDDA